MGEKVAGEIGAGTMVFLARNRTYTTRRQKRNEGCGIETRTSPLAGPWASNYRNAEECPQLSRLSPPAPRANSPQLGPLSALISAPWAASGQMIRRFSFWNQHGIRVACIAKIFTVQITMSAVQHSPCLTAADLFPPQCKAGRVCRGSQCRSGQHRGSGHTVSGFHIDCPDCTCAVAELGEAATEREDARTAPQRDTTRNNL